METHEKLLSIFKTLELEHFSPNEYVDELVCTMEVFAKQTFTDLEFKAYREGLINSFDESNTFQDKLSDICQNDLACDLLGWSPDSVVSDFKDLAKYIEALECEAVEKEEIQETPGFEEIQLHFPEIKIQSMADKMKFEEMLQEFQKWQKGGKV